MTVSVNISIAPEAHSNAKKTVTWGDERVAYFLPISDFPESCPDQLKEVVKTVISGRRFLINALESEKIDKKSIDTPNRTQSVRCLHNAIQWIKKEGIKDSYVKNVSQIAHILLARAYCRFSPSFFVKQVELIRQDPDLKHRYDNWIDLLKYPIDFHSV